jgi:hypothetical protein
VTALRQVAGVVVDEGAEPVPGALVAVVESSTPVPEMAIRADEAGRFGIRLPEGRFRIRAHAPDGRAGEAEIEVPGNQEIRVAIPCGP